MVTDTNCQIILVFLRIYVFFCQRFLGYISLQNPTKTYKSKNCSVRFYINVGYNFTPSKVVNFRLKINLEIGSTMALCYKTNIICFLFFFILFFFSSNVIVKMDLFWWVRKPLWIPIKTTLTNDLWRPSLRGPEPCIFRS